MYRRMFLENSSVPQDLCVPLRISIKLSLCLMCFMVCDRPVWKAKTVLYCLHNLLLIVIHYFVFFLILYGLVVWGWGLRPDKSVHTLFQACNADSVLITIIIIINTSGAFSNTHIKSNYSFQAWRFSSQVVSGTDCSVNGASLIWLQVFSAVQGHCTASFLWCRYWTDWFHHLSRQFGKNG